MVDVLVEEDIMLLVEGVMVLLEEDITVVEQFDDKTVI